MNGWLNSVCLATLVVLLVPGCFSPSLDDPVGGYRCSKNEDCPPGQTCHLPSQQCRGDGVKFQA